METRNILKYKQHIIVALGIICAAAASRLLPHPPNMTPLAGVALFSSATLGKKWGIAIALGAMSVSDMIIGFHNTMIYVYGSIVLIAFLGQFLAKHRGAGRLFGAALTSSALFFIITNFGVWATGTMYTKDIPGLINAYVMGLPFLRNTMVGDILYSFALFYGFQGALVVMERINYRLLGSKSLSR